MANLAQFDLGMKGQEARTRALLEDLVEYYMGQPQGHLVLAVWYAKSSERQDQYLLLLFSAHPTNDGILQRQVSLRWKTGSQGSPFVHVEEMSADWFSTELKIDPKRLARYRNSYDVLYFDKNLLSREILEMFEVKTEPGGLMKGWYISEDEYARSKNIRDLLSLYGHTKPNFGLVKTEESSDFENCRGVLHVEISQKWLPLSPEGIRAYTYYNDRQNDRPVYFLFEGGSLYRVLKFEVKTAPEYAGKLLEKTRDDRYPEAYLRAVHPSAQPAA
jgi:hypothetical protein